MDTLGEAAKLWVYLKYFEMIIGLILFPFIFYVFFKIFGKVYDKL